MTERHRRYLIFASIFGVLVGMFSGALVAIAIAIVLVGFGGSILMILERAYKGNSLYVFWMSVAVGAIILGLAFLGGAIIFLTLHEGGAV